MFSVCACVCVCVCMNVCRCLIVYSQYPINLYLSPLSSIVSTLLHCVQCQEACGQGELTNCAKPLSVLSSTSELSIYGSQQDLDNLCPDLKAGLHCIRSYTRRCMDINQREHFNKLYQGTSEWVVIWFVNFEIRTRRLHYFGRYYTFLYLFEQRTWTKKSLIF